MKRKQGKPPAIDSQTRDLALERNAGPLAFMRYFASLAPESQDAWLREQGETGDDWACRRRTDHFGAQPGQQR
ncbi:hypothetical protein ABIE56_000344 [Luteibacter sp. 621]|uniref:hypothetical protein n=1 Tax=Luteibacter sp. 621 TaxID=3373916 RepID=UPI003D20A57B